MPVYNDDDLDIVKKAKIRAYKVTDIRGEALERLKEAVEGPPVSRAGQEPKPKWKPWRPSPPSPRRYDYLSAISDYCDRYNQEGYLK